ncbi:DUF4157 domain-containing protein [Fulvivirga kasyanovii]|uniref:eCIS core domain-containing protein n=1 Tax=Fulvivirga kasyanovii TaxID=396812 RepID=UPI001C876FEA|nr:DUF4157 domain-containing protein [Fulvivirga kasyanovii]
MNDQLTGSKDGKSSVNRLNQNSSSLDSKFGSNLDAKNQFADNVNPVTQLASQQAAPKQNQNGGNNGTSKPTSKTENKTGLPDNLKAGIEGLSGYSMDDVKVHYNSSKPDQLQALAYAQGTDIHVGPGQEQHLPHEAWHVVQQKQGRVKPTRQMKSKMDINDDPALEKEADVMGKKSLFQQQAQLNPKQALANTGQQVVQRVVKVKGKSIVPEDFKDVIASLSNFLSTQGLNWTPVHAALLTLWLQDRDNFIVADDIESLIYNLYYHGDDETSWQNMQRVPLLPNDLQEGQKRRKRERMASLLEPSKVQTTKSVEGLEKLGDDQLLRLAMRNKNEEEFWKRGESGELFVAKRRKLAEEDEARIVASGDVDDPSYVVWKKGRQLGHRYKGSKKGKNHSKKRTYGSKKDREGYEYKGSGLVDGHSVQAQDDQLILGPTQSEAKHWTTTVKTSSGPGATYDDWSYLPKNEKDQRFIEKMPYNFYWENQEQGRHFRQKGIEAPALKNKTSFLHLNEYTGDTFNPNNGNAMDHEYEIPSRIDYLLDDGAGTKEHLIADNRPKADYSKPQNYDPKTHQYGDVKGAPSHKKNKNLGGISVTEHVKLATQPTTKDFSKATVLRPHSPGFSFLPFDRYEDAGYLSPPPSPHHVSFNLDQESMDLDGDHREKADLQHKNMLVDKVAYDKAKKKTRISLSAIKKSSPKDWVPDVTKFGLLVNTYGANGVGPNMNNGQDYLPTDNQNLQLTQANLSLNWILPDGFCIFNSVGAVTNQNGVDVWNAVLNAIDNNINNIQHWIEATYGGGNFTTWQQARETVLNIRSFWGTPRADIVLPLIAEVLNQGFTVIQDNQPAIDVKQSGGLVLVKVISPHEHYHATR